MKRTLSLAIIACLFVTALSGSEQRIPTTFCNPIDLSYRFQLEEPSRREAADPTIVWFKDRYYLFASMSSGYWHSKDLIQWDFIETNQIPTEEYAPCAVAIGDTLYFLASSQEKSTIYKSDNPMSGKWTVAKDALKVPVWDPALFLDSDNRLYLFWGCSNVNPIFGVELDTKTFDFIGEPQSLLYANPSKHGWEVPGDYNTLTNQSPWIEGPWINKHNGTYYLQYAGPGTEYKSYSDGVYTSQNPLGPYTCQPHNPFAYKPEGFAAGAGHGSTFRDLYGNYWHIGTITISQKHVFERRLGLYRTFIDKDGILFCDTRYGDFPIKIQDQTVQFDRTTKPEWMLLSYGKPVTVSSAQENHPASFINDEDIRTYWAASGGAPGEFASIDLGSVSSVYALQLNFAEDETHILGRQPGIIHRYQVLTSQDGNTWEMLIDRSDNTTDNTHVYVELPQIRSCRFVKVINLEVPGGSFAMSGFRIFGIGSGSKPATVSNLKVDRNPDDRRSVTLTWQGVENATGYVICYGIDPEKLYQSCMVFGKTSHTINSLDVTQEYFYTIETFNENGVTESEQLVQD